MANLYIKKYLPWDSNPDPTKDRFWDGCVDRSAREAYKCWYNKYLCGWWDSNPHPIKDGFLDRCVSPFAPQPRYKLCTPRRNRTLIMTSVVSYSNPLNYRGIYMLGHRDSNPELLLQRLTNYTHIPIISNLYPQWDSNSHPIKGQILSLLRRPFRHEGK